MADCDKSKKNTPGFVVLGIVIAILGVLTVISSTYSQYQNARQDREAQADRDCMHEQIVAIAEALDARQGPSTKRDDALERWARAVTKSRERGEKALPRYLNRQRDFENAKNQNDFPNGVCEKS